MLRPVCQGDNCPNTPASALADTFLRVSDARARRGRSEKVRPGSNFSSLELAGCANADRSEAQQNHDRDAEGSPKVISWAERVLEFTTGEAGDATHLVPVCDEQRSLTEPDSKAYAPS